MCDSMLRRLSHISVEFGVEKTLTASHVCVQITVQLLFGWHHFLHEIPSSALSSLSSCVFAISCVEIPINLESSRLRLLSINSSHVSHPWLWLHIPHTIHFKAFLKRYV